MAVKGKSDLGDRSNRFRFVMIEADINDSNVNMLAQAIVTALRPEAPATLKRVAPVAPPSGRLAAPAVTPSNGHEGDADTVSGEADAAAGESNTAEDEPSESTGTSTAARTRKPTKPPQPKYVDTLFPSTAEADAFKAFVAQYPTKKHSARYLVAALFLRDHGHAIVDMDKIYTCYRMVNWPMTVNDWDVNLRNQTRNDRFRRAEGGYAITTNGENIVQGLRAHA
jgi:hypothetical protein